MVPMGVGEKNRGVDWAFWKIVFKQVIPKFTNARSCINDNEAITGPDPQFYTHTVATIFLGGRTWAGYGTANAPKTDFHTDPRYI